MPSFAPFEQTSVLEPPFKRHRMLNHGDSMSGSTNITLQEHSTLREERGAIMGRHPGFRGCTIWFTGLSGAGKTTISFALEKRLTQLGIPCYGIDGDNVRHGLCKDLSFEMKDRVENIRRVAEVAKILADSGQVCLASFISPIKADREAARKIHQEGKLKFVEVHISTSLEVCEQRDPKKLYKMARAGELHGFTGIDSAYEVPENAELVLDCGSDSVKECVDKVLRYLWEEVGIIPDETAPLRPLMVEDEVEAANMREKAVNFPSVDLTPIDLQWLQVLGEGWASPLPGFMRERQYLQVLHWGEIRDLKHKNLVQEGEEDTEDEWHLQAPVNQSILIVLPIDDEQKAAVTRKDGSIVDRIALRYEGRVIAILSKGEVYEHRKKERVCRQFGYPNDDHPGVAIVIGSGDWCLGGDIQLLERIKYNDGLDKYRLTPAELRKTFNEKGADCVFAFQLRNPIHNGHAILMKDTRQKLLKNYSNPMLLLHPLGGWTKDDDVPLPTRIRQHEAVMASGVLDPSWTVLAIFPSPMMYAGPTEVQWHARARIAAGANAYIVGRDPAGVPTPNDPKGSNLYEATHGAKVLSMAPGLSQLQIVPFRVAAFDKKAGQMAFYDPKRHEDFDFISGTKMRGLARSGQLPPDGFMVPEAWQVLAEYYKSLV